MKKLNKLVISPEKIMKNEELIDLHGGYESGCGTQWRYDCSFWPYGWDGPELTDVKVCVEQLNTYETEIKKTYPNAVGIDCTLW